MRYIWPMMRKYHHIYAPQLTVAPSFQKDNSMQFNYFNVIEWAKMNFWRENGLQGMFDIERDRCFLCFINRKKILLFSLICKKQIQRDSKAKRDMRRKRKKKLNRNMRRQPRDEEYLVKENNRKDWERALRVSCYNIVTQQSIVLIEIK